MPDANDKCESLPIPTYEEATASGSPSTSSGQGQQRPSEEAELHRLLGVAGRNASRRSHHGARRGNYEAPTVESARSSFDSAFSSQDLSDNDDDEQEEEERLRQDMEEMEVQEPGANRSAQQRRRLRLPKPFQNLRQTLSSISLPFLPIGFPTFRSFSHRLPEVPLQVTFPWSIIARLFGLFLIVTVVYTLMVFRIRMVGQQFSLESVLTYAQGAVDPKQIEKYLWQVSFDDHIAGTKGDFYLAAQVKEHMESAMFDAVFEDDYEVYLNYPRKHGRRVAIIDPPNLEWKAKLEEDLVPQKENQHQAPVFHGHSRSGNVTGPLIYANYGSEEDFAYLTKHGVDLRGAIVLVRYYGSQGDRALKVKAAELAGAAGCLIYSDPGDDGEFKGKTYPHGRWRPTDSVQRGAVSVTRWRVGDVLTPGWASRPDNKHRLSIENNEALVNIPSMPLAWRDAEVLLKSLKGSGLQMNNDWKGGAADEFEWWTGNLTSSPTVHLKNLLDDSTRQPIRNIIGKIHGFETPDKAIYVGNHRDAWCFGAVDPGSGTAAMMELIRIFGELRKHGWRPRRSIVFASWDAKEYNLIGSTEHVEDRIETLRKDGVAYLNIDSAVSGTKFRADGSPILNKLLMRVLKRVNDPKSANATLWDRWVKDQSRMGGLDAEGDYVAFQDLAGCSSLDFGFSGPVGGYPYHSCYDSFNWMKEFGDPDFTYHAAAVQVWALLTIKLADEHVIPFDMEYFAMEVQRYIRELKDSTLDKLDMTPLEKASERLSYGAARLKTWEARWNSANGPLGLETKDMALQRMEYNKRLSDFETNLLDLPAKSEKREGGIPGRTQFKHVIFGPQAWPGYDEAHFAAVRDAVEQENLRGAREQLEIAARVLDNAAAILVH